MFRIFSAGDEATAAQMNQVGVAYLGASAVGTDAYAVNPTESISAYVDGMQVAFKADVANTGPATLNINSVGAKAIVKGENTALATGDIAAGQIVEVIYNATDDNFLMITLADRLVNGGDASLNHHHGTAVIQATRDITAADGAVNYAHGLGHVPKFVEIQAFQGRFCSGLFSAAAEKGCMLFSHGFSDGSVNKCTWYGGYYSNATSEYALGLSNDASNCVYIQVPGTAGAGNCYREQKATASFDATNVTLTWDETNGGSTLPTGTIYLHIIAR